MPSWARRRRDRDHRQPAERGGVLGDVDGLAAADARRPRRTSPRARAWPARRPRATPPSPSVAKSGVRELRPQRVGDLLAQARARRPRRRGRPREIRRSARSGASCATAPGPMSTDSGAPIMRVSSGKRSPARGRGRVVVDLDPLDLADRRDADVAAAVGVLLEAVLVVELRVALEGGLSASASPSAASGSISVSPMYSPCAVAGSSALVIRVIRPVGDVDLHLLVGERLLRRRAASRIGRRGRRAASPRRSPGARCRR